MLNVANIHMYCIFKHVICMYILFYIYTVRQKLSTTWFVSIISFLIMNLFQIGLLFSLPVHTYLLTCETGYWSIFIYLYMTGCVKCHVYFSTSVFVNESWFFVCRVLSFIFYWFGMVRRKLTIPERWQAVSLFLFLFLPCNCLLHHVEDYAMTFGLRILVELIKCVG